MENNRTILFFDESAIQEKRGLSYRWFQADVVKDYEFLRDEKLAMSFNSPSVLRDENGQWHLWATGIRDLSKGDEGCGLYKYKSENGLDWQPDFDGAGQHRVFGGEYSVCGGIVFYDAGEQDSTRRYKIAYSDLSPNPIKPDTCKIACSPDGRSWTIDREAIWQDQHTDTAHHIRFNYCTGKYQFTSRPILGDRRIALYQTKDFKTFEPPFVIMHPDWQDPEMVEFYGMPIFEYEGYYLGFLWKMYGAYTETTIAPRFKGKVDAELVYSINGIVFNRTNRQPFIRYDEFAYRSSYPGYMIDDGKDGLLIYSLVDHCEHNDRYIKKEPNKELTSGMQISRLRKDGFVALETTTDKGHLTMRPLFYKGGDITVNVRTAAYGALRAELRSVPDGTPIKGFELGNSIPISGDHTNAPLRWNGDAQLEELLDQPVRIHFELYEAQLYALRMQAVYLYGYVPQTDMNGTYLRGMLSGLKKHQIKAYAGLATKE